MHRCRSERLFLSLLFYNNDGDGDGDDDDDDDDDDDNDNDDDDNNNLLPVCPCSKGLQTFKEKVCRQLSQRNWLWATDSL